MKPLNDYNLKLLESSYRESVKYWDTFSKAKKIIVMLSMAPKTASIMVPRIPGSACSHSNIVSTGYYLPCVNCGNYSIEMIAYSNYFVKFKFFG